MANVTIEVNFGKTTLDAIRSLTMKATAKTSPAETDEIDEMTSIESDDGAPRTRRTRSKKEETEETEETYGMADADESDDIDVDLEETEEEETEEEEAPARAAKPRTPEMKDVQAALVYYRKKHGNNDAGHAKAIKVMEKITGQRTLAKVDPKKYAKLIAALK